MSEQKQKSNHTALEWDYSLWCIFFRALLQANEIDMNGLSANQGAGVKHRQSACHTSQMMQNKGRRLIL
jgi:hypothetical protein